LRAELTAAGHDLFCKPAPLCPAIPGGFTMDDFTIDTAAGTVTCPAGHTARLGAEVGRTRQRAAAFGTACTDCPLRPAAPRPRTATCACGWPGSMSSSPDLLSDGQPIGCSTGLCVRNTTPACPVQVGVSCLRA
jgi:hypothetical protein